jgi:signal transduction histidine kinase
MNRQESEINNLQSAKNKIAELEKMKAFYLKTDAFSDSLFKNILDQYPGILYCTDVKGSLLYFNRQAAAFMQRYFATRFQLGRDLKEHLPDSLSEKIQSIREESILQNKSIPIRYIEITGINGENIRLNFSTTPLINEKNEVYANLTIANEINRNELNPVYSNLQTNLSNWDEKKLEKELLSQGLENLISVETLQPLQDAISLSTGLAFAIANTNGTLVTRMSFAEQTRCKCESIYEQNSRKCNLFRKRALKDNSDIKLCPIFQFSENIIPIHVGTETVGMLIMGNFLMEDQQAPDFKVFGRRWEIPASTLEEVYQNTPVLDEASFFQKRNIQVAFARHLSSILETSIQSKLLVCKSALQKEKEQQQKKAKEAQARFMAYMNHEIRTPLNSIIGSASLLKDSENEKESRELVEAITLGGENLLNLVNDALDLSKIDAGKVVLEQNSVDLQNLIQEVKSLHQFQIENKGIAFYVTAKKLPDCPIKTDRMRLLQVLNNIISNSIKFTPEGKISIEIDTSVSRADNTVEVMISIADTGIGIEPEKQKDVFEPFAQLHASDYNGTGLGLTICRKIMKLMNGGISLRSKKDEGTTFILNFSCPLENSPQKTEKPTINEREKSEKNLDLMVVDDSVCNRKMTMALMRHLGYRPKDAGSGPEALDSINSEPVDLVLLDIRMPHMDGFEVARILRQRQAVCSHKKIPLRIIALTADKMKVKEEDCKKAGIDKLMYKPITLPALGRLIREELNHFD